MKEPLTGIDAEVTRLRRDVLHWNGELARLKAQGRSSLALERWLRDAERLLRLWN